MSRKVRKYYNHTDVGCIGQSDHGDFMVISADTYKDCVVQFVDTGFIRSATKDTISKGALRDVYFRSVYGEGYLGEGPYKTSSKDLLEGDINYLTNRADSCWRNLLGRCYDTEHVDYIRYGALGAAVKEEWKNFQGFCEFFSVHWSEGLRLDKDILIPSNKVYSPDTCAFVPTYVNNLIVHANGTKSNGLPLGVYRKKSTRKMVSELKHPYGVDIGGQNLGYYRTKEDAHKAYQIAKAERILEVLNRYKTEPFCDPRVIDALELRAELLKTDASNGTETLAI